jgi:Resolvase, N terminal domain
MKPIVSYVRVSTNQQGRSGLGIDAQREALARFARDEGFEIVAEFVEVETGKGSDALIAGRNWRLRSPRRARSAARSRLPSSIVSRATCISFPA